MGKATELQACLLFTVVASGFQCFVVLFQVDLVEVFFGIFMLDILDSRGQGPESLHGACFSPVRMMCTN